jgi:hypothetical protein
MANTLAPRPVSLNGFVAFVDVLGWSWIISEPSRPFGDLFEAYSQCIDEAARKTHWEDAVAHAFFRLSYVVFSDCVILYTEDDSQESFEWIVSTCSRLFYGLLKLELPFRGCLTSGQFWRYENESTRPEGLGVIIAGQPLVEAYRYEQMQDWIGIMLSPHLLQNWSRHVALARSYQTFFDPRPRLRAQPPWNFLCQYCDQIPLKNGSHVRDYAGFAITPTGVGDKAVPDVLETLEACIIKLNRLRLLAPDVEAQAKYQRTVKWLGRLVEGWKGVAQNDPRPDKKSP